MFFFVLFAWTTLRAEIQNSFFVCVSLFTIILTDKNSFAYLAKYTVLLNKQFIYVNRLNAQTRNSLTGSCVHESVYLFDTKNVTCSHSTII